MDAATEGLDAKVHYHKVSCCPKVSPCPHCEKLGKRKQRLHRLVRSIAYGKIVYVDITYAEYRAMRLLQDLSLYPSRRRTRLPI